METLHHYVTRAKVWATVVGYSDKYYLLWYVERAFESNENKKL